MSRGIFEINILNANISKDLNFFNSMSPFFRVRLSDNNLYISKEASNEGKFPNWNDKFKLPYNGENVIVVDVMNKNILIGNCEFSTLKIINDRLLDGEFKLINDSHIVGKIRMKISFISDYNPDIPRSFTSGANMFYHQNNDNVQNNIGYSSNMIQGNNFFNISNQQQYPRPGSIYDKIKNTKPGDNSIIFPTFNDCYGKVNIIDNNISNNLNMNYNNILPYNSYNNMIPLNSNYYNNNTAYNNFSNQSNYNFNNLTNNNPINQSNVNNFQSFNRNINEPNINLNHQHNNIPNEMPSFEDIISEKSISSSKEKISTNDEPVLPANQSVIKNKIWFDNFQYDKRPLFFKHDTDEIYEYIFEKKIFENRVQESIANYIFPQYLRCTEIEEGFLITGGIFNGITLNSCKKLNRKMLIEDKQAMNFARKAHTSIYIRNHVYVFGGFGTHGPIDRVEKYDILNNKWINLNSLNIAKAYVTACRYGENYIFLIGGFSAYKINGESELNIIERYDVNLDKYDEFCIKLKIPVYGCMATFISESKLFIAGGYNSIKGSINNVYTVGLNDGKILEYPPLLKSTWTVLPCYVLNNEIFMICTGEESDEMPECVSYDLSIIENI